MKQQNRLNKQVKEISIFIPVKNEIESMPQLEVAIAKLYDWTKQNNFGIDVFIHDNNSTDGSWEYIAGWAKRFPLRAFKFKQDIGYQESLALAFENAEGDAFVILQSDLQDPIEIIYEMIEKWSNGAKSVIGIPIKRNEHILEKIGRKSFVFIFKQMSDMKDFEWFTDFYLLDKQIYRNFRGLPLVNQFIRGRLVAEINFDCKIKYERNERKFGKSSFNFTRRYNLAISAILLHSSKSIRKIVLLSGFLGIFSVLASVTLLILSAVNILNSDKIGLYSVSLLILLNATSMIVLFGLALEYLSRIHYRLHSPKSLIDAREELFSTTIGM